MRSPQPGEIDEDLDVDHIVSVAEEFMDHLRSLRGPTVLVEALMASDQRIGPNNLQVFHKYTDWCCFDKKNDCKEFSITSRKFLKKKTADRPVLYRSKWAKQGQNPKGNHIPCVAQWSTSF